MERLCAACHKRYFALSKKSRFCSAVCRVSYVRRGGGAVFGTGAPTSDLIRAPLSDGEYVISASAVRQYGRELPRL